MREMDRKLYVLTCFFKDCDIYREILAAKKFYFVIDLIDMC